MSSRQRVGHASIPKVPSQTEPEFGQNPDGVLPRSIPCFASWRPPEICIERFAPMQIARGVGNPEGRGAALRGPFLCCGTPCFCPSICKGYRWEMADLLFLVLRKSQHAGSHVVRAASNCRADSADHLVILNPKIAFELLDCFQNDLRALLKNIGCLHSFFRTSHKEHRSIGNPPTNPAH